MAEIAAMMDDRTRRLAQHTAQTAPAWAITALGPVPADQAARHTWENKAAPVAAYRETYGYGHPDDPIGAEPSREVPDQRAAWHQAFAVLGPADGPDIRAMPDGQLWLIRDTYAAETAWAPPHTGRELRQARLGATNVDLGAIRAAAEAYAARKVGDHSRAASRRSYPPPTTPWASTAGSEKRSLLRTTPPPSQPQDRAAALRRTRTRQRPPKRSVTPGARHEDR